MSEASHYSPELSNRILDRMAEGESLRQICRDDDMPNRCTVLRWVRNDHDGFQKRYEIAQDMRALAMAEDMVERADSARSLATGMPGTGEAAAKVQAVKLEVDTRKWLLARMAPRRFGDKMALEHSGPDGKAIKTEVSGTNFAELESMVGFIDDLREKIQDPEQRKALLESLPDKMKEGDVASEEANSRLEMLSKFNHLSDIADTVKPPASWRGMGSEE